MYLTFSSKTHSIPKVLFVNIVEGKEAKQAKPEPIPTHKKKKEIPRSKKKDSTRSLPQFQEETLSPIMPNQKATTKEMLEKGNVAGKQETFANSNLLKREEEKLQKAEKQGQVGDPIPGTEASSLPLKPSTEPGKFPVAAGATWLGAMSGTGKGRSARGNAGEGEKSEKEIAGVGKLGGFGFQGAGKGQADLSSYLATARMKIEKAKRCPRVARRKGCEGKEVVSFQIDEKGKVEEIKLVQSCGYPELDGEAIATLRRASPFPSPLLIEKEKLLLEVPILFKLE